jgi:hypothetical protein
LELDEVGGTVKYVGLASGFACLWMFDATPQYIDALDGVLSAVSARRHAPRPLIRSIIEHAALSAWMMEPGITLRTRVSRALLAEVVSADQMMKAMKHGGNSNAERDASDRLERVHETIEEFFGQGALKWSGSWANWTLADEPNKSLTQHVEDFANRHFSPGRGRTFYMFHSALVHPSPVSATIFGTRHDDGTIAFIDYDPAFLIGATHSALWSWRVTVEDIMSYHGWTFYEFNCWCSHMDVVLNNVRGQRSSE